MGSLESLKKLELLVIVLSKLPAFPHDILDIHTIKHEPIIVNGRGGGGELENTCL